MQFIPSSWAIYSRDANGDGTADPHQVDDAALATAGYLCAGDRDLTSTQRPPRRAVFGYNHSWDYVDPVLAWADAYAGGTPVLTGSLGALTDDDPRGRHRGSGGDGSGGDEAERATGPRRGDQRPGQRCPGRGADRGSTSEPTATGRRDDAGTFRLDQRRADGHVLGHRRADARLHADERRPTRRHRNRRTPRRREPTTTAEPTDTATPTRRARRTPSRHAHPSDTPTCGETASGT